MTVFRLVNCAWQIGDDATLIRNARDGLGFDEPADVLCLVEARDGNNKPLDIAAALGRGWSVSQDTSSGAKSGSVLAVRRETVRLRWSLLRLLSRKGHKVQDRYQRAAAIRVRHGKTARVNVLHNPLKKTGKQPEAITAAHNWVARQRRKGKRWMVAGDFNLSHREMCNQLGGARSFGEDVMGYVLSDGWGPVVFSSSHYKGSDHAVLTLVTSD